MGLPNVRNTILDGAMGVGGADSAGNFAAVGVAAIPSQGILAFVDPAEVSANPQRGFATASVTGLPNAALLENVEQALYGHELMGFDVQIKAPDVTDITVAVEFAGDADGAEVVLAVENYVHGLGIGGRFAIRELYALLEPLNLKTVEIILPERDVQAGEAGIVVLLKNT